MPCHARSSSISRRHNPIPLLPPLRRIAVRLNHDVPGELQASELIHRYTTGRWPLWRLLSMHRQGNVLYCAVEWLRSSKQGNSERYALAEVALDHVGVRWHHHGSAAAARAALRTVAKASATK